MNLEELAVEIDSYLTRLFSINRSITGNGVRETFRILKEIVPIEVLEYESGTEVYDWTIPDEWVIHDAYIKDSKGTRVVDFRESNLHVVGYSNFVCDQLTFDQLSPHLHYFDDGREAIPYRTGYYKDGWGFCITREQLDNLKGIGGIFDVCIDAEFKKKGSMTIAELRIPGKSDEEYLISTYCCHPSMANDNLSGLLLTCFLARELLQQRNLNKSWRIIIVPETIGAIAYLYFNEAEMKKVSGGLLATTCGGPGDFGYKESFLSDSVVDRAVNIVFRDKGLKPKHYSFVPDGSDERQYSSPGFRIPIGTITRDKYYEYDEYHTSADNLDFVNGCQIAESLEIYREVIRVIDRNKLYASTNPHGEPQLGRRGLYPNTGGTVNQPAAGEEGKRASKLISAIMWVMFASDGRHDLIHIAERSGIRFDVLVEAVHKLHAAGLLDASTEKH